MDCKQRGPAARRRAGLVAAALLTAFPLFGQVETNLSDRFLVVGEQLTYTVLIDHEEASDVAVRAPEFEGLRLVEGPAIRPVTRFRDDGGRRAVEVRFVFAATEPGRFVLPAIPVSVAGQLYLTERRLLEISSARNQSVVPFRARWSGPTGPLLAGQSAAYSLEIYNVPEFLYPQSLSLGRAENAILEEVQGLGEISRIEIDGTTLYTIPVAVFMLTATGSGSLRLPEATISTGVFAVEVAAREVPLQPLPPAVELSGAVGDFDYDLSVTKTTVPVGETVDVVQRITGTGNLHFLSIPQLEISGFQLVEEQNVSQLIPRENGYHGQLERVTTLRALSEGPHRIHSPAFASIEPDERRIDRQSGPPIVPVITAVRQPARVGDMTRDLEPLSIEEAVEVERRVWFTSPFSYGWFVPGILFLIATRFWKKPVSIGLALGAVLFLTDAASTILPHDSMAEGLELYAAGEVEQAIEVLEREHRTGVSSPSLEYNLSVLYFKVGDIPRSVYAAREAIRLAPRLPVMRGLLSTVEGSASLNRSVAPRHIVHPDLFFAMLAASVNAVAVLTALAWRRKRGLFLLGQLVTGILVLVSLVGLIATSMVFGEQLGVVTSDYNLRRIPTEESAGWLVVPEGTAVDIASTHDQFVLVKTAAGLEGWVSGGQLLWPGNPEYSRLRYRLQTRADG